MPSPILCDWCQTTVFDRHYLAVIDPEKKDAAGMFEDQDPFAAAMDPVAYFSNRDALAGFTRSFRQNTESVLQNASRGCVFCMLLKDVRGGLLADFEFTITVKNAWEWSAVAVAADGDEDMDRICYFRVYKTVGPTESASPRLFLGNSETPEQDAKISPANGDLLQYESSLTQQLARDGQALHALIDDCTANHPNCEPREGLDLPSMLLHVSGTLMSPIVCLSMCRTLLLCQSATSA